MDNEQKALDLYLKELDLIKNNRDMNTEDSIELTLIELEKI